MSSVVYLCGNRQNNHIQTSQLTGSFSSFSDECQVKKRNQIILFSLLFPGCFHPAETDEVNLSLSAGDEGFCLINDGDDVTEDRCQCLVWNYNPILV